MAEDLNCSVADLMRDEALRKRIDPARYVTSEIGLPTLNDILAELAKPGRDPRAEFEAFRFADGIEKIEDLTVGMKLPGIVTNITAFGAFVDIGVHQDGLVHLSQIADRYVKDPGDVLKVRQVVEVTVIAVDLETEAHFSFDEKKSRDRRLGGESAGEIANRKGRRIRRGETGSGSAKPAAGKIRPEKAESRGGTERKQGEENRRRKRRRRTDHLKGNRSTDRSGRDRNRENRKTPGRSG